MKTKPGTYYYIKIGDGFYAGTRPVMVEATKKVVDQERLKELRKHFPKYQMSKTSISTTWKRAHNVKYHNRGFISSGLPTSSETIMVPSAEFVDELTLDFNKAKKFRIKSKALAKADELAKANSMSKMKPQVLLYEGDR